MDGRGSCKTAFRLQVALGSRVYMRVCPCSDWATFCSDLTGCCRNDVNAYTSSSLRCVCDVTATAVLFAIFMRYFLELGLNGTNHPQTQEAISFLLCQGTHVSYFFCLLHYTFTFSGLAHWVSCCTFNSIQLYL